MPARRPMGSAPSDVRRGLMRRMGAQHQAQTPAGDATHRSDCVATGVESGAEVM